MFYEIYIDVFFFVNMMLDLWVLFIVKKLKHYKSTKIRMLAAAAGGALCFSVYLCLPGEKSIILRGITYVIAYAGMAYIAFGTGKKHTAGERLLHKTVELFRKTAVLYGVGLLVNGIFHYLALKTEHVFELAFSCVIVYLVIQGLVFLCFRGRKTGQTICAVRLLYSGNTIVLDGLWDTGNSLYFEGAQKGVSVINYECLAPYISSSLKERIEKRRIKQEETDSGEEFLFFLPYETVSDKYGVFPVVMAQRMTVELPGECLEYKNPLLALNFKPVSKNGEFQMILTTSG